MKKFAALLFALVCSGFGGVSPPDPFSLVIFGLSDNFNSITYKVTAGLTIRSPAINPALKTLVLITAGQSNWANVNPTLYTPTNSSVVDQFNIFDGATYSIGGPLLGSTYNTGIAGLGPGNPSARVADTLVTNAKFDRVIIVSTAIGSTTMDMWANGDLSNRIAIAMRRLSSRGITPATTGVTFAMIYGQGEAEGALSTTQLSWTNNFNSFKATAVAAGFSGRIFVPQETFDGASSYAPVRAAQAAVVDNVTVFSGGDLDTLTGGTNRVGVSPTHFTDAGAASAAAILITAMHASGAPY